MGNNLLSAKATLPVYDRNNLAPRIVHLGFGAFHRAHQGVYADILATEHFSEWGYYEVNLIGGEQQIADLQQQDNLYTVAEMSADAWTARVVGVVKKALHVQIDGLETVLAALHAIATRRYVIEPGRLRWMAARNCHSGCWILFAGIWRMTASSICWRWASQVGCVMWVVLMNREIR